MKRRYFQVKPVFNRTLSRTYFQTIAWFLQHQPKYSYTGNFNFTSTFLRSKYIYKSLFKNLFIVLQFVDAETNWISNILVSFAFNAGDQNHDSFLSSIMLENIDNHLIKQLNIKSGTNN